MRILIVSHYYSTHRGGIELVAGQLASRLGESHQVVWAASDCDPLPEVPSGSALRCAPMNSLNIIERLTGLPFPLWGPISLARLWREVRRSDVVHIHDFAYLGSWVSFVFATFGNVPVVITQHVGFIPYQRRSLRLILRTMHATLGRTLLGAADQVVFVSSVVRDYYAGFVRLRRPPVIVANGVDTDVFVARAPEDRSRARLELGLDPDRPTLLFVGRFVEKKGLRLLEALARRLPEATWLFAGWGPIDPREWKLPNVRVIEDRQGSALVPLYHAADLLVLPSVGEGLPLVLQEALSCGTRAIVGEDTAAAVNAPKEMVLSCSVAGPTVAVAWESAIRGFLNDRHPSLSNASVAAFARSQWTWKGCAASYARLFAGLAPPSNRGDKY